MYVNLKEILEIAEIRRCAIPAFNVYNQETVLGVMNAALETRSPVIFQLYSRLFEGQIAQFLAPMIMEVIHALPTPAAFHLDHGSGIPAVQRALRCGVSGVMIDASTWPLEENIVQTQAAVKLCQAVGVPVEGELGHIGKASEEITTEHTCLDEAVRFANETQVSALAIMVGTAHGRYKKAPEINIRRICEIHEKVNAALVLHGGSGVPDDQIQNAIKAGIRKINFGTDLCYAFLDALKRVPGSTVAVDLFMAEPVQSVQQFAVSKIALLGSGNYV